MTRSVSQNNATVKEQLTLAISVFFRLSDVDHSILDIKYPSSYVVPKRDLYTVFVKQYLSLISLSSFTYISLFYCYYCYHKQNKQILINEGKITYCFRKKELVIMTISET